MATENSLQPESFVRLPEVLRHTGLTRSTVYRLAASGDFPKQFKLGERASAWRWGEVVEWIESRERAAT